MIDMAGYIRDRVAARISNSSVTQSSWQLDGIQLSQPHLKRKLLIKKVMDMLSVAEMILIHSSPGSGKTSLLYLLANHFGALNCDAKYFSCLDSASPFEQLKSSGIDIRSRNLQNLFSNTQQGSEKMQIIMIDDAQKIYQNKDFWNLFVKNYALWKPRRSRVVISSTHLISTGLESIVEFQSFPKLTRQDMLLSREEFCELTSSLLWLPTHLDSEEIRNAIYLDTGGLIGEIRTAVESLLSRFGKVVNPPVSELLNYLLSKKKFN